MKKLIITLLLISLSIILIEAEEFEISPSFKKALLMNNREENFYQNYEWLYSYYEPFINLDKVPNIPFLNHTLSKNNLRIEKKFLFLGFETTLHVEYYF